MVSRIVSTVLTGFFLLSTANAQVRAQVKKPQAQQNVLRQTGLVAYQAKDYPKAINAFYQWSRQTKNLAEKQEAKFYLGTALAKMELFQVATFPIVDVVRSGESKYRKKALNLLANFATQLDEKALLKFTLEKLSPEDLTELSKAAFFLNLSEIASEKNQLDGAISWAQKSLESNPKGDEALYQLASLALEKGKPAEALAYFTQLLEKYNERSPQDKRRGLLLLNIARTHYQNKEWSRAIEYYRQIPKDHPDYRFALQELSWALLRAGQLRSALSPLKTLTSPFYSQFFDPETLVLSASIYIFSCQFNNSLDDADIFERNYLPAMGQLENWLGGKRTPDDFYGELVRAQNALETLGKTGSIMSQGQLPFFVLRAIIAEADVQAGLKYLKRLDGELNKLKVFSGTKFYDYAAKILKGRALSAKRNLAKNVEFYLSEYLLKTAGMADQISFIRYEALDGIKNQIKGKIIGAAPVEGEQSNRDFYAQNGYRYWPFEGEYWRDELGSYQYVGENLCEK